MGAPKVHAALRIGGVTMALCGAGAPGRKGAGGQGLACADDKWAVTCRRCLRAMDERRREAAALARAEPVR